MSVQQRDESSVAVFTADEKGYVQTFPPASRALFGWSADEVVGKRRVSLFHKPEDLRELLPKLMKLPTEGGVVREEVVMVRKDKTEFRAHLRVAPMYRDNAFVGYSTSVQEVED